MWPLAIATVVVVGCVAASLRRLWLIYEATSIDPELTARELRGASATTLARKLVATLAEGPGHEEERALFVAIRDDNGSDMSEALLDVDHRFERWVRVPRVCASIASSAGLMLATWALRIALNEAPAMGDERFNEALDSALGRALGVAAIGAAGTVACIAIYSEARRVGRARRAAADKLFDRLARLAHAPAGAEGGSIPSDTE